MDIIQLKSGNIQAVNFKPNKKFHYQVKEFSSESNSYKNCYTDESENSEILTSLLQIANVNDNSINKCYQNIIKAGIKLSDLASITDEDLKYFGLEDANLRKVMLRSISIFPNQEPTYEHICNAPEANCYNSDIITKASTHLKSMGHIVAATGYKLRTNSAEDVLMGEKYFASHFALDALIQLKTATESIQLDVMLLKEIVLKKKLELTNKAKVPERSKMNKYFSKIFLISSAASCLIGLLCYLRIRKV